MDLKKVIAFTDALAEHKDRVRFGLTYATKDTALAVAHAWGYVQAAARLCPDGAARDLYGAYAEWVVRESAPGIDEQDREHFRALKESAAKRLAARLLELAYGGEPVRDTEPPPAPLGLSSSGPIVPAPVPVIDGDFAEVSS